MLGPRGLGVRVYGLVGSVACLRDFPRLPFNLTRAHTHTSDRLVQTQNSWKSLQCARLIPRDMEVSQSSSYMILTKKPLEKSTHGQHASIAFEQLPVGKVLPSCHQGILVTLTPQLMQFGSYGYHATLIWPVI